MASEPNKRIRVHVFGRVQRVGFRQATLKKALELGVTGSVRNLPDGHVEVVAIAAADIVDEFIDWLQVGPTFAKVERVELEPFLEVDDPEGFVVLK